MALDVVRGQPCGGGRADAAAPEAPSPARRRDSKRVPAPSSSAAPVWPPYLRPMTRMMTQPYHFTVGRRARG
jgi:hypothetical protein